MTRYCPKCGEPVPNNCITCPKCYAKIPQEPARSESDDYKASSSKKSRGLMMFLAIVPGFFGLLGLGMIYNDYRDVKGYVFLIIGFILFITANTLLLSLVPGLIGGILKTILGVGLLLLYILGFIISVLITLVGFNITVRKA